MEKVKILLKKNYLTAIKNSEKTKIFQNCFSKNKKAKNLTEGGLLSCSFFVSSVLYLFGLIPKIHLSVKGAVRDMKKFGWIEVPRPKKGSVILWEEKEGHYHLGFYLGGQKAISNDFKNRAPKIHHFNFGGKRKIEKIFWHKRLDSSKTLLETVKEP